MSIKNKENKINKILVQLEEKANRDFIDANLDKLLNEWFTSLENNQKLNIYKEFIEKEQFSLDDYTFN